MLFEWISRVYTIQYVAGPLSGIVFLIWLFFMKSKERMVAIFSSLFVTLLGCHLISPIDLGAWGFGVIEYFFAIPFWFSIGVMLGQFVFYRFNLHEDAKIPVSSFLLGFYVTMILLHFGYATRARQQSNALIHGYLTGQVSESRLINDGHHRRGDFNEIMQSRLSESYVANQILEPQIRFLLNRGINIYRCANTPADLIEGLLNEYEANPNVVGNSHGEQIRALCLNPNLRLEDFMRLAKLNPYGLGWTMKESPTFDRARCEILMVQLELFLQKQAEGLHKSKSTLVQITFLLEDLNESLDKKEVE